MSLMDTAAGRIGLWLSVGNVWRKTVFILCLMYVVCRLISDTDHVNIHSSTGMIHNCIFFMFLCICTPWSILIVYIVNVCIFSCTVTRGQRSCCVYCVSCDLSVCLSVHPSVRVSVCFYVNCFFSLSSHRILMKLGESDMRAVGYEVTEQFRIFA